MDYYLHEVPGRLRVKIPNLKQNEIRARALESMLKLQVGVVSVSVNTVTGSALVLHDIRKVTSGRILALLVETGHLDVSRVISSNGTSGNKFVEIIISSAVGLAVEIAFKGAIFSLFGIATKYLQRRPTSDLLSALTSVLSLK
jgi:hypothetical protein